MLQQSQGTTSPSAIASHIEADGNHARLHFQVGDARKAVSERSHPRSLGLRWASNALRTASMSTSGCQSPSQLVSSSVSPSGAFALARAHSSTSAELSALINQRLSLWRDQRVFVETGLHYSYITAVQSIGHAARPHGRTTALHRL